MSSFPRRAVHALSGYIRRHPGEFLRAAKNAAALKVGVPVSALLWLIRELGGKKVPEDLLLEARSPGIYARASFELMKTPLRGGANIIVQSIKMGADEILVELRFEDISLEVTSPSAGTPIAALLQSGALDLSRPGDLLSYMPKRPALVVSARGNVLTLDLLRHPKLSKERARKLVALFVPLIGVESIQTEGEHLDVAFQALPGGPGEVIARLRELF